MLPQPLLHQLHELRLRGMAAALEQQLTTQASNELTFDERLALLIQHELVERQSCRLRQRLRWAKLTQAAALERQPIDAVEEHAAAGHGRQPKYGPRKRRLATAAFPDKAEGRAAGDVEADAVDGLEHARRREQAVAAHLKLRA